MENCETYLGVKSTEPQFPSSFSSTIPAILDDILTHADKVAQL